MIECRIFRFQTADQSNQQVVFVFTNSLPSGFKDVLPLTFGSLAEEKLTSLHNFFLAKFFSFCDSGQCQRLLSCRLVVFKRKKQNQ